jgi:hypothetical protein
LLGRTRIEIKRTLADCAVDGRIPIGLLQSKEQMYNELIMWLERLERNEICTFKRRDLNMQLTSIELEHAKRKISEFGLLNRLIIKNTHRQPMREYNKLLVSC